MGHKLFCVSPKEPYSPANKAMSLVLKSARTKAELTNETLAQKSGVPYGTVVKLMSNRTKIDTDHLTALAPALERTPQDLLAEMVRDLGGMPALEKQAADRARAQGVERLSVVAGSNVTKLSDRKKNSELTAEQIENGREDKAATEVDPESEQDQSDET